MTFGAGCLSTTLDYQALTIEVKNHLRALSVRGTHQSVTLTFDKGTTFTTSEFSSLLAKNYFAVHSWAEHGLMFLVPRRRCSTTTSSVFGREEK